MPRSTKRQGTDDQKSESGRNETVFGTRKGFNRSVDGLGGPGKAAVLAAVASFEREWKTSHTNDDLSPGFHFKQLASDPGHYRLCEIYARADFRAAAAFLHVGNEVYWVHAWKKTKMSNRKEVETAKSRAHDLWNELQRRNTNGKR
jgi:hypothetical protein